MREHAKPRAALCFGEGAKTVHHTVVRSMMEQKPFVPFRVFMADRSVHEVRDPNWVELTDSALRLYRPDPSAPGGRSWHQILSLDHLVVIQPMLADEPAVVAGKPAGS